MQILSVLTAFGLGAIVTTLVQAWLAQRCRMESRSFEKRKAACIGLLEAYHHAAVEKTDEAAKEFAYWQMRCDLVASETTRNAIVKVVETNDDLSSRNRAHGELIKSLRRDLGIALAT